MIGIGIGVTFINTVLLAEWLYYSGEPITYNGQIITSMADIIAIYDKRTVTILLPEEGDVVVDGSMVAGAPTEPITAVTKRGIKVIDADSGLENQNWGFVGGADPTAITVYSDNIERTIYVIYEL